MNNDISNLLNFDFTHLLNFYYILLAFVHIAFAAGVARDSGQTIQLRGSTILVGPYTWAFATLIGGVWVAAIYWLLHHFPVFGNLSKHQQPAE